MSNPFAYSRNGRARYWTQKRKAQLCEAVMANETPTSAPIMQHIDDFSDEELLSMIERYMHGGFRALSARPSPSERARYRHMALEDLRPAGNA